jgi:oxygen-independent coproporphyrinogen III oxidase
MTFSPPGRSEISSPGMRTPAPSAPGPATSAAAGLYLHIPFCKRKCPYCDFTSTEDLSLIERFLAGLSEEMAMTVEAEFLVFDTLYIGGGTPSLLGHEDVNRILETARRRFTFSGDVEITLEMNPGTVTREKLAGYRMAGIDRVNIGVQSFREDALRFLGRIHTARQAAEAVALAREAGFTKIGLDLIYGLPGQSEADWRSDLDRAATLSPEHLSCYMLTYEPDTPLTRRRERRQFSPLPEAAVADLFRFTISHLRQLGYKIYEISNFARTDEFQSRHNRKYWRSHPYIGLGPSAHSFVHPVRWWNHRETPRYLVDVASGRRPLGGQERLTPEQVMTEAIYLGLRTGEGIDTANFNRRFGADFKTMFSDLLAELAETDQIRFDGEYCGLTVEGMLFLDTIAQRFVDRI